MGESLVIDGEVEGVQSVSVARHDAAMGGKPDSIRTTAQLAGDAAETLVLTRLVEAGWTMLARNVHVGRYELDLVAVDPGPPATLVIVEVRWRRSRGFGLAEETVDHRKRTRVRQAGYGLLDRGTMPDGNAIPHLPLRFDLVVIEPGDRGGEPRIRHHRAAF